ncbi:unnamed protein product, partial [Amoebophrya sp. A25]
RLLLPGGSRSSKVDITRAVEITGGGRNAVTTSTTSTQEHQAAAGAAEQPFYAEPYNLEEKYEDVPEEVEDQDAASVEDESKVA